MNEMLLGVQQDIFTPLAYKHKLIKSCWEQVLSFFHVCLNYHEASEEQENDLCCVC